MNLPRVIFFGTDDFSAPTLRSLLDEADIDLVAVITKPDSISGRGKKILPSVVSEIITKHNAHSPKAVKLLKPEKLRDINDEIAALRPDLGALVSFGKLIPESIINLFPRGIVNIHPSILPLLRGPSPVETAILDGLTKTGVSLISLVKEMDAGPIIAQETVALTGDENAIALRKKLSELGAKMLTNYLPRIISGGAPKTAQNDKSATFSHLITKDDAILDPGVLTAAECDRRVRAFLAWPKSRLNLARTSARFRANFPDQNIILTNVKVLPAAPGDGWPDVVICRDNTALKIETVISPKSGKEMTMNDFLRGLH